MPWGKWLTWIGALLAIAASGVCLVVVDGLQQRELSYETVPYTLTQLKAGPDATGRKVRIGMTELHVGQEAVFEVCSADGLPDAWRDQVTLRLSKDGETVLDAPLDEATLARAKRNDDGACLLLGSGPIKFDGLYAIDAHWEGEPPASVMETPVRVRILGRPPLDDDAGYLVIAIAAGIALMLVGLLLRPAPQSDVQANASTGARLAGGLIAVAALGLGSQVMFPGSALAVVKGAWLVGLQVGIPMLLCRYLGDPVPVREQLALGRPSRPLLQVPLALALGVGLTYSARIALRLVPRTGLAPIETFLSWPSGMLAFGALGVVLPLAEEVLFRGYLYRLALPLGRWAAGGISLVVFIVMHAQQVWGNWGALLSIAMTGAAMTALRMWSGSAALPALSHTAYNFLLTMASF